MSKTITIATFQHKHGSDVRAFATKELAETWRQEIAADNWDGGPNEDMPADPREAADRYFEFGNDIGDEFFSTEECEVEGGADAGETVLDGFHREHGCTPSMMASDRDIWLKRAEVAEAALRTLVAECRAHLDYEDDEDMEAACDAAEAVISAAEGRR